MGKWKEFNRRSWLENRFQALNVGQFDEMARMDDDSLESMVNELEAAQDAGQLDLETDAGLLLLQTIVERYEPAQQRMGTSQRPAAEAGGSSLNLRYTPTCVGKTFSGTPCQLLRYGTPTTLT